MDNSFVIPQVSISLNEVAQDFETWRKSKPHSKSRIPEKLWEAAVALTATYPVSKVSQILKLNHTELKRRVEQKAVPPCGPSFIPVDLPACSSVRNGQPGSTRPTCLIELESSDGIRFRCTVYGTIPQQLLTFCQTLLLGR
ncbi:hypothetical protein ACFL27_00070 [candidate division CSSED10-310 bacterium]|uniref:Transposase n=1 Tax=candidate division CSSED10-310 bacterium TaxID=2855610 RepID=A0ABV6YQT6_UNCC1